jgi:hypothetical protein
MNKLLCSRTTHLFFEPRSNRVHEQLGSSNTPSWELQLVSILDDFISLKECRQQF